jgi:hypothetical protein
MLRKIKVKYLIKIKEIIMMMKKKIEFGLMEKPFLYQKWMKLQIMF